MRAYRRLRLRMLLVCAGSTGLVLAAMAVAAYLLSAAQLRDQFAQSFAGTVNAVHFHLREQPVLTHSWLLQTEWDGGLRIGLESDWGYTLYREPEGGGNRDDLAAALALAQTEHGFDPRAIPYGDWQRSILRFELEREGTAYRAAVARVPVGERWLTVTVLGDRAGELEQMRALRLGFAAAAAGATLCLVLFAWVFSRWATRPAAESQRRQVAFVAAASHEFRAPVAVIRMAAENLEGAAPRESQRFREMILRECGRLGRLTGDMLQLAGADSQGLRLQPEPVNPEAMLLSAWEDFQPLAARAGIRLDTRLPAEPLPRLSCDRERVEQLLAVLLDNALEHTPRDGTVLLGAERAGNGVLLWVADSGPGVPDREKEAVFRRFYRGDAARSDKAHYGLGLSIAREIALLHRGRLWVEDNPGGGSRFLLRLPL